MKYIDSFQDIEPSRLLSDQEKTEATHEVRELIFTSHMMLDKLMSWREHNLNQIALHDGCQNSIITAYVDLLKHENKLFDINGLLMLYYGDIMIAYKNIITIYDDWEIRVHIRRIYTLLYEILNGFCKSAGHPIGYLKEDGKNESLAKYDSSIKDLRTTLEAHKSKLYDLRNNTEAHKASNVSDQIALIENISILDSIALIECVIQKLNNVMRSMTPLFNLFNLRIQKLYDSIVNKN